jgi:hypothetical protein
MTESGESLLRFAGIPAFIFGNTVTKANTKKLPTPRNYLRGGSYKKAIRAAQELDHAIQKLLGMDVSIREEETVEIGAGNGDDEPASSYLDLPDDMRVPPLGKRQRDSILNEGLPPFAKRRRLDDEIAGEISDYLPLEMFLEIFAYVDNLRDYLMIASTNTYLHLLMESRSALRKMAQKIVRDPNSPHMKGRSADMIEAMRAFVYHMIDREMNIPGGGQQFEWQTWFDALHCLACAACSSRIQEMHVKWRRMRERYVEGEDFSEVQITDFPVSVMPHSAGWIVPAIFAMGSRIPRGLLSVEMWDVFRPDPVLLHDFNLKRLHVSAMSMRLRHLPFMLEDLRLYVKGDILELPREWPRGLRDLTVNADRVVPSQLPAIPITIRWIDIQIRSGPRVHVKFHESVSIPWEIRERGYHFLTLKHCVMDETMARFLWLLPHRQVNLQDVRMARISFLYYRGRQYDQDDLRALIMRDCNFDVNPLRMSPTITGVVFEHLRSLDFSGMHRPHGIDFIEQRQFPTLRNLYLRNMHLLAVPTWAQRLVEVGQLSQLEVSHNRIRTLPSTFARRLPTSDSLKLRCAHNQISELPEGPWNNLKELDISFNMIETVPDVPDTVKKLAIQGNPIKLSQLNRGFKWMRTWRTSTTYGLALKRTFKWLGMGPFDVGDTPFELMVLELGGLREDEFKKEFVFQIDGPKEIDVQGTKWSIKIHSNTVETIGGCIFSARDDENNLELSCPKLRQLKGSDPSIREFKTIFIKGGQLEKITKYAERFAIEDANLVYFGKKLADKWHNMFETMFNGEIIVISGCQFMKQFVLPGRNPAPPLHLVSNSTFLREVHFHRCSGVRTTELFRDEFEPDLANNFTFAFNRIDVQGQFTMGDISNVVEILQKERDISQIGADQELRKQFNLDLSDNIQLTSIDPRVMELAKWCHLHVIINGTSMTQLPSEFFQPALYSMSFEMDEDKLRAIGRTHNNIGIWFAERATPIMTRFGFKEIALPNFWTHAPVEGVELKFAYMLGQDAILPA